MMKIASSNIQLSDLPKGSSARIMEVDTAEVQMALVRLGITPGDTCVLASKAPFGDPLAIAVNGTKIAIRKRDAAHVWVSPIKH